MSVENINTIWKGQYDAHNSPANVLPAISKAEWDQKRKKYLCVIKPIADAAAGTTYEWPFFHNPWTSTLTVTNVSLLPFAALTADNSNYKTVALNRRVAAGSATVIASRATTITDTGNWVALTPITLTLSATAADLVVPTLGDLSIHLVFTGTGVVVPVFGLTVEYYEN